MSLNRKKYLETSALCDFDVSPEIKVKALALTAGCRNRRQEFEKIFAFVKELPYGLGDWDLRASDVLRKGWGMCSGKTNLLVALLRSIDLPACYRVYRIKAEPAVWDELGKGSARTERLNQLGEERDHVDCEVWLGRWVDCDPGRDTAMEKGMLKLGATLERRKILDRNGKALYTRLANFDVWAKERQERRTFRSDRHDVFSEINRTFDKLRELGNSPG